jgi:16S rRNA (adenine1518-N6/adenine1519-N6)-dimethyltransferase
MKTSGRHSRKTDSLLTQTEGLLRRFGLRAKKGLGQHFLIDEEVLGLILSTAQLTHQDVVLEVGSGLGVLTRELAKQAGWVLAIELDDKLATILKQSLSSFKNISIINEDVLKIDPAVLIRELKADLPSKNYKVVANLPYYITSPVLRHFLEAKLKPQLMVVMVQKEVAEEIAAKPGRMSLLSVSVQLYGTPVIAGYVPAQSFYPAPEVDSALLKIVPYSRPPVDIETESFFALVRAGFSASRKQLVNSLAQGLGVSKMEALSLLEKAKIVPQQRAETLSLEEWARLWRVHSGAGK